MVTEHTAESGYLEPLVAIAHQAGRRILDIYADHDPDVTYKEDDSPLTRADIASHEAIVEGLERLTPGMPILSEEGREEESEDDERGAWQRFWLVDPLDGTKEFLSRNGEFTVNVALVEDGEPILAVVHAPVLGRTYFGLVGHGAWRRDLPEAPVARNEKPRGIPEGAVGIGPSAGPATPVGEPDRPLTASSPGEPPYKIVASRSHPSPALEQLLDALPEHELVRIGSSLKICLVAEGAADLYPRLGPTMEWDVGAGDAVLRAAGGRIVDVQGAPLRYNKPTLFNPFFVAEGKSRIPWREAMESISG